MNIADDFGHLSTETLAERGGLKWTTGGPGSIGAFVAEMDFGTDPKILAELHRAVDRTEFGYLPAGRVAQLQTATAGFLASRFGWAVDPEHVHHLPNVITALEKTIRHFTTPGTPIIVPTPAYMPFLDTPPELGREVIRVPLIPDRHGRLGFDLPAIAAAFAAGAELFILCNPYNPVGRVFDTTELTDLAATVAAAGGRVFADEIWAPMTTPGHQHVPYASISEVTADHTITAISASKAWNIPGLKCAQLITSNARDRDTWRDLGPFTGNGTAGLGVIATIEAYSGDGAWQQYILGYLLENRDTLTGLLRELIPQIGFVPPEGTYVAWLDLRGLGLEDPVAFFRERAGVLLSDGADCGAPGFARLIYAMPRPLLREAITRMARALDEAR